MTEEIALNAKQVEDYLRAHPDFLTDKNDLLAELVLTHKVQGAASLVERQLAVYRQQVNQLKDKLNTLLENARRNDQLFAKSRRLVLALTEAKNWLELQAALDDALRNDFKVDAWALLHLTERKLDAPLVAIKDQEAQEIIKSFYGKTTHCGSIKKTDIERLLNTQDSGAKSVAAIQIRSNTNHAVLTIASNDADRYPNTTDTLFLEFFADLLALRLAQLPVT
ncbi:MAG: DUF484 family protein [Venatoribacter sp.]